MACASPVFECTAGFVEVYGECRPSCTTGSECGADEVCEPTKKACVPAAALGDPDAGPSSPGPHNVARPGVGHVAGGGQVSNGRQRLRISVGSPYPTGTESNGNQRLTVGPEVAR